jgi:membrane fusion protein (multidrug efflux system)
MTNPNPEGGTTILQSPKPNSKPPMVRTIVICTVLLLTIAAVAIAVPWASYRFKNIVLREAAVRGAVTKIGARIDGRIKSIEVAPGERVTKGQVLLRMEDSHLRAALERARGDLKSAKLELENEKLSIAQVRRRLNFEIERSKSGIKKAQSELAAQKSNLEKVEKQYDRTSVLVKTGAAAVAELDRITADRDRAMAYVNSDLAVLEVAETNHERARNELEGLLIRENRLGVLEAQISVAEAKVAMAEADMESAIVSAPEDGRVLERIVNVGGSAKVGEPILSLWIGKAWVEAWADERDLHKIHVGKPVDISFDASPDRKLTGRVESIGLVTDKQLQPALVPSSLHAFTRQSAMVPIRIALDDENPPVQLGLSVLVGIRKGEQSGAEGATAISSSTAATTNNAVSKLY